MPMNTMAGAPSGPWRAASPASASFATATGPLPRATKAKTVAPRFTTYRVMQKVQKEPMWAAET